MLNRQWILTGHARDASFIRSLRLSTQELPDEPAPGTAIVRNLAFQCAPSTRNKMGDGSRTGAASFPLGSAVGGPVGGVVVASCRADLPVGARISYSGRWEEYAVLDTTPANAFHVPADLSLLDAMAPLGPNAMTAYFGLTDVGQAREGDVVVVSGAAGSTGSSAAQIAKALGCTVAGIAGGPEKCSWLSDVLGLDLVIDYKSQDVGSALRSALPGGVDIFYDNVGGPVLNAVIDNMATGGRVVVCGQISGYNGSGVATAGFNMLRIIYRSLRVQGFVLPQYYGRLDEARSFIEELIRRGAFVHREDVRVGFESLPRHYGSLFDGSNRGTLLVASDDEAAELLTRVPAREGPTRREDATGGPIEQPTP